LTVSFSEIIEQPKNASALRLNQVDRVLETAVTHFENFMYGARLVVASHHKDNIERPIQR
jgi:hypothetical protein